MTMLWENHPMAVVFLLIFVLVLLLGALLPLAVYFSSCFMQWYMAKHPELVLAKADEGRDDIHFGDAPYVEDKGESGFKEY